MNSFTSYLPLLITAIDRIGYDNTFYLLDLIPTPQAWLGTKFYNEVVANTFDTEDYTVIFVGQENRKNAYKKVKRVNFH